MHQGMLPSCSPGHAMILTILRGGQNGCLMGPQGRSSGAALCVNHCGGAPQNLHSHRPQPEEGVQP